MADIRLEVCVDTADSLAAAVAGGADRIELCAALDLGGLTPSPGAMRAAAGCARPVYALIRPRAGDFVFSDDDLAVMLADIAAARDAGLAGVVLGASRPDGRLDARVLSALGHAAEGMGRTLHRAFDLVPDLSEALDLAVELGFERVLTSGGETSAIAGRARLEETFRLAQGRLSVMPGAGITAATVTGLRGLPLREVHASCSVPGEAAPFGLGAPRRTEVAAVRALKAALVDLGGTSG